MSKQYPGGIISKTPPVPTQVAASGVWTLDQQAYWQKLGQWPTPGYKIQRSLRFNSADTTRLSRTFTVAGDQQKWTWSGWFKRSALTETFLFGRSTATNDSGYLHIQIAGSAYSQINFSNYSGSINVTTTQVLKDLSAWYHLVVALDTTQATASNRLKIYLNGVLITSFAATTYPGLNDSLVINDAADHAIGDRLVSSTSAFNGYMTEINFVNAQQLTPSSFGETNADTGVWSPMPYTGAYGTNGFYLNFSDNSNTTAATLGKDYSGNGNNWTPNNFSVTAGAGNDSMVDTPTPYGTDTGAGGEVRGNYSTLNPLNLGASATLANGNLDHASTSTSWTTALSTIGISSGKWYFEATMTSTGEQMVGIANQSFTTSTYLGVNANSWSYYSSAQKYTNASATSYGATYTNGDVIGVALDMDAGTIVFYKNGTSQGTAFSSLTGTMFFGVSGISSTTRVVNFGQRAFAYTAPSGFKALCTQNLPTPTIGATSNTLASSFFAPVLYTGTGATLNVTNVGFQPDWVWIKSRSGTTDHGLYDAVRGVQKQLESNTTTAETTETTGITAFGSDGFTTGALAQLNTSSATYVAWNWKANGAGSTNTAGSITSTVSANTTSGFSVATFTKNATTNETIGHGLGVAPSMIIVKARQNAGYTSWAVFHTSIGIGNYLELDTTAASQALSTVWNNTLPTSTVFSMGTAWTSTVNMVAYCFAPIAGYSAFGSYTGNGSANGPFIYTGFRPAFVMVKNTASGENWVMLDATRNTSNVTNNKLAANSSAVENDASIGDSTQNNFDFLSNGFKAVTTNSGTNGSSAVIIYMAFAQNPFKYSLAR